MSTSDPRLVLPRWEPTSSPSRRLQVRATAVGAAPLALLYLWWLLQPGRVGNPVLYAILVVAELFNLVQAIGFWWTAWHDRADESPAFDLTHPPSVDVLIPVYDESVAVVAPTVRAASRLIGGDVRVHLLDDKGRPELAALARRNGALYIRRGVNTGAKAGNLNHAIARTTGEFIAVLDCDHVPDGRFLIGTLGHFRDSKVALVQTPQYYANTGRGNAVADASWAQQSLFFGVIARGKAALGAMFCCGTNVVFRRTALESVGGFPEDSLTEDFELSIGIHEQGWKVAYVPRVLARGLGPEDVASYASQQHRWARGCISSIGRIVRSRLRLRTKLQFLLSASYFLTGWTAIVYMALPVIRILTGAQPLAGASADAFLVHFAPYFGLSLLAVAVAGAGSYTFAAFALAFSSWWIHVHATIGAIRGRPSRFVVTPKKGADGVQLRPVRWPLAAMFVLAATAVIGVFRDASPATLNNVSFLLVHISVLAAGIRPALLPARPLGVARRHLSPSAHDGLAGAPTRAA